MCGQVNMHPLPPLQAHTCCRVYGSDTKAVSNCSSLPRKAKHQPRTPHLPSSKGVPSGLEKGKQSTALPRWQPGSDPPAAERPPRPAAPFPADSPEDDGVPHHDVVLRGGPAHPGRGILLQPAGHRDGERGCAPALRKRRNPAQERPLRKRRNPAQKRPPRKRRNPAQERPPAQTP